MNQGKLVFAQLMQHLPLTTFRRCVARYHGEFKVQSFSCLDQFLCMTFAQLTYRESLRDIEVCLRAQRSKLYHFGIGSTVARNTLAHANAVRDWRIYADFAQSLIGIARPLYAQESFGVDLQGNIPTFIHISDGKMHEVNILDQLLPEPGAFYIMDRGFLDFERLHRFHQAGSFFVTRGKSNLKVQRRYSRPVDRKTGLICDQSVVLTGFYSHQGFEAPLRRIRFKDPETAKPLVFLTNNFVLPAFTITELYRCRWQVELFFKWIKQHLRIKAFYGISENAVKSQIWIAVSAYVLVAIVKKRLRLSASLYEILQILSLTMFEKIPLHQLLAQIPVSENRLTFDNQFLLFN